MENFKIDVDSDGIALITFDVPGRSMNTITASVVRDLYEIVDRIKSDEKIKGAVVTSGIAVVPGRAWYRRHDQRAQQAHSKTPHRCHSLAVPCPSYSTAACPLRPSALARPACSPSISQRPPPAT